MRGIESKEKKIKDYDLRSKVKVQQIGGCSKQKLESKEQLRLKTALLGKRKMARMSAEFQTKEKCHGYQDQ